MFNIFRSDSRPDHLAAAKHKVRELVALHLKTLAMQRHAGLSEDAYGKVDSSKWIAETQYFVDKLLLPQLSIGEVQAVLTAGLSSMAQEFIETPVREECRRMQAAGEHDMTIRRLHPTGSRSKESVSKRRETSGGANRSQTLGMVTRGLIIREEPLARILSGAKTWEMRSGATKVRGTVALIQKGSKAIFGVADIVDSRGPFSRLEMLESVQFHGIVAERLDDPGVANYRFSWVLKNVRRLPRQINYIHKGGVTFVTLDELAVSKRPAIPS